MVKGYKDEDYLLWLQKQPCVICGYRPKGERKRYDSKTGNWEVFDAHNAAAHIGDGEHTRKYDDRLACTLCDTSCDPRLRTDCHHGKHHREARKWDGLLRRKAQEQRSKYERGG